jgi:hypothetical protein
MKALLATGFWCRLLGSSRFRSWFLSRSSLGSCGFLGRSLGSSCFLPGALGSLRLLRYGFRTGGFGYNVGKHTLAPGGSVFVNGMFLNCAIDFRKGGAKFLLNVCRITRGQR